MDFKQVLASWGYNIGNSVPVETLINEILPDMIGKKVYTESEVVELLIKFNKEEGEIENPREWFNEVKNK